MVLGGARIARDYHSFNHETSSKLTFSSESLIQEKSINILNEDFKKARWSQATKDTYTHVPVSLFS